MIVLYSIVTICSAAASTSAGLKCEDNLVFIENASPMTRRVCESKVAGFAAELLEREKSKRFVAAVRCGVNEERGA